MKRIVGLKADTDERIDLIDYQMAKKLSEQTIFAADSRKLYYFVREGFQETNISEGFTKNFHLTNEMINGQARLDGRHIIPLGMGDSFSLSIDPRHHLKCMKLII